MALQNHSFMQMNKSLRKRKAITQNIYDTHQDGEQELLKKT